MEHKTLSKVKARFYGVQELGVLAVLIVIGVVLSLTTKSFLTRTNLINVVRQFSEISIMAVGMTFVIICSEIDLSVGSIYGICAIISGYLLNRGGDPALAFILALSVGIGIGAVNGFLVTKFRIPAFIATLSMMQIVRGGAYGISKGWPISQFPSVDNWFFGMGERVAGIPIQIFIMILINIVASRLLSKTTLGFQTYAVGGNANASRLSGINNGAVKTVAFMISGALAALGGMIGLAYLQSVAATAGAGRELDVIAAVIIGGTSMSGGKGTILGTFLGAAIMGVVRNGMVLLGVQAYYQEAFIGLVILVAVLADTWLKRARR